MIPDEQYGILVKKSSTLLLHENKVIREYEQIPSIRERHITPRPIQIVYIETIEEPWRQLALELERKYVQLMLEIQNKKLNKNGQIGQKQYQEELEQEIEKLEQQLKQLDEDYDDKSKLLQQLQIQETKIESTSFEQESQLEEMKQKFKKLNNMNSETNEQIVMLEAQIEAIKQRQTRKSIITTTNTNNKSQIHVI